MKKIYFVLGFALFSALSTIAQVAPRWTAIFQGTGDYSDRFNKVISDGNGNFIGVGYTIKKGNYKDILVVKFDPAGDTLWWRTKNGKGNADDEANAVAVDATGNVYVTGRVDAGNQQDNVIVLKFQSNGTPEWDTTWDSPAMLDDEGIDIAIDGGGNCIVGGNTEPDTVSGSSDIAVLKFAPNGGLQWATVWSRTGVVDGKDEVAAIAIDNNNNIYATGRSFGSTDDFILLQCDGASGNVNWQMPYNGGGEDRAVDVAIDNAGNIVIAGSSDNGSNLDFRINKYDNAGLLQWTRSLSAPASGDEKPSALAIDLSDNIYVTGSADISSGAAINLDFQTLKYNSAGTLQWVRRDGSPFMQEDAAADLTLNANGDVFVTGKSDQNLAPATADYDYMTIAYSTGGSLIWGPVFHAGTRSGADDLPGSIVLDNGTVYVGGVCVNNGSQKDATVVKYNATDGTEISVKDFNGTGDFSDEAKAMAVDANNVTYAAGSTFVESNNLNAAISKIDNAGNVVCTYQYAGVKGDDDEFKTIAISPTGAVYAAGYTKVSNQKRDMLLVKFNTATCDTDWTRTYDYTSHQSDRVESMVIDNAGFIYITGRSDADPQDTTDNDDIVTIKYDQNGNVQWISRYDASAHLRDEPAKIVIDKAGDLVIGGRTENIHDDDFIVIKYNPVDGLMRPGFPVTYGGPFSNDDRVTDIAIDQSNDIYVAGYSQTGSGNSTQDPTMIAYDASGNILPAVFFIYSSLGKDEIPRIDFDPAGDLLLLNKFADGTGPVVNYDYVLYKFHPDMTQVWMVKYDDSIHGDDVPADMTITPTGDVYVTGTSDNDSLLNAINKNIVTVGYDTAGNQIFYANANGSNSTDDSPNQIIIRGTTIWVCGYTEGNNNNQKDLTVVSYDLPLSVPSIVAAESSSVYPNPFSDKCRILLGNTHENLVFEVYDVLGNRVAPPMNFTGDVLNFDRGSLADGIYQYQIRTSSAVISSGKLIIN